MNVDRSDSRGRLGGTALRVVDESPVPCLVVGEVLQLPVERVLVAVDLSSRIARDALAVCLSWASALRPPARRSVTIDVIHVGAGGADKLQAEVDAVRDSGGSWAGVTIVPHVLEASDPATEILRQADLLDANLVVIGTRRHASDDAKALGSVASVVVDRVRRPLLLIPPSINT